MMPSSCSRSCAICEASSRNGSPNSLALVLRGGARGKIRAGRRTCEMVVQVDRERVVREQRWRVHGSRFPARAATKRRALPRLAERAQLRQVRREPLTLEPRDGSIGDHRPRSRRPASRSAPAPATWRAMARRRSRRRALLQVDGKLMKNVHKYVRKITCPADREGTTGRRRGPLSPAPTQTTRR